jgi:penicillin-binding protein 1C
MWATRGWESSKDVDIIDAPRSTGSILKPLLYAGMLLMGAVTQYASCRYPNADCGLHASNFNLTFDGAVPAHRALSDR